MMSLLPQRFSMPINIDMTRPGIPADFECVGAVSGVKRSLSCLACVHNRHISLSLFQVVSTSAAASIIWAHVHSPQRAAFCKQTSHIMRANIRPPTSYCGRSGVVPRYNKSTFAYTPSALLAAITTCKSLLTGSSWGSYANMLCLSVCSLL